MPCVSCESDCNQGTAAFVHLLPGRKALPPPSDTGFIGGWRNLGSAALPGLGMLWWRYRKGTQTQLLTAIYAFLFSYSLLRFRMPFVGREVEEIQPGGMETDGNC